MGARYVSIVTRDSTEYLIPNEDLITHQVVNWSFSSTFIRIKIGIGVSYDSDVHQVMELMITAAQNTDRVLDYPQPVCQLKDFGDHAIEIGGALLDSRSGKRNCQCEQCRTDENLEGFQGQPNQNSLSATCCTHGCSESRLKYSQ